MNPIVDEAIDFIFERSRETKSVMTTIAAPPYNKMWDGVSPGNYGNMIDALDTQQEVLSDKAALTSLAAAEWDHDIALLLADAVYGSSLARVKWKNDPVKLHLFQGLRHGGVGRDEAYRQALDFESSWRAASPAWIFNPPLTLALFKQRREALRTREDAHIEAEKTESRERSLFHVMANDVNEISMDWYETATTWFGPNTVPGALVRTIPTTYDPDRPPGALVFKETMSAAPNQVLLKWRAPRGEKFFLRAKGPGQSEWQTIVENETFKEWVGLGLTAGVWQFEGWATNQFGTGPTSGIITVNVSATAVA
jgi:hypothetical protein